MDRKPILRVARATLVIQAALLAVVGLVALILGANLTFIGSIGLGGLSAWLSYLYVAWRIVRNAGKEMPKFVSAFMLAEVVKFAIAIVLLAGCFLIIRDQAAALLIGFGTVIAAQFTFPILLGKELQKHGGTPPS